MIRRPPSSTRTDHSFPTRRSSDLSSPSILSPARTGLASMSTNKKRTGADPLTIHLWLVPRWMTTSPAFRPRIISPLSSSMRSEEHTSELQSLMAHLVCRLLLEKQKKTTTSIQQHTTEQKENDDI